MTEETLRVTLRDYLERRLDDLDVRYEGRFKSAERAVQKAEDTINSRLAEMNEFREAMKDQAATMARRSDVDRVEGAVNDLLRAKSNLDGRIGVIVAIVSVIVSAATVVLTRWWF